jgi:hypothetical protein
MNPSFPFDVATDERGADDSYLGEEAKMLLKKLLSAPPPLGGCSQRNGRNPTLKYVDMLMLPRMTLP